MTITIVLYQYHTSQSQHEDGYFLLHSGFFSSKTIIYFNFGEGWEGYTLAAGTPTLINVWIAVARHLSFIPNSCQCTDPIQIFKYICFYCCYDNGQPEPGRLL